MNAYSVPGSVLSIEDAKIDLFMFGGYPQNKPVSGCIL